MPYFRVEGEMARGKGNQIVWDTLWAARVVFSGLSEPTTFLGGLQESPGDLIRWVCIETFKPTPLLIPRPVPRAPLERMG